MAKFYFLKCIEKLKNLSQEKINKALRLATILCISLLLLSMSIATSAHKNLKNVITQKSTYFLVKKIENAFVNYQLALIKAPRDPAALAAEQAALNSILDDNNLITADEKVGLHRAIELYRQAQEQWSAAEISNADVAERKKLRAMVVSCTIAVSDILNSLFARVDSEMELTLSALKVSQHATIILGSIMFLVLSLLLVAYVRFFDFRYAEPLEKIAEAIRADIYGPSELNLPRHAEFAPIATALDKLRSSQTRVQQLVSEDPETGLLSRIGFEAKLQTLRAERLSEVIIAVEYLKFSTLAAAHGGEVARHFLIIAAQRWADHPLISYACRDGNVFFALLRPNDRSGAAHQFEIEAELQAVLSSMAEPIGLFGLDLRLFPHAGLASFGSLSGTAQKCCDEALQALSLDTHDSLGWTRYTPELAYAQKQENVLISSLEIAINSGNQLQPFFQPIINIKTAEVVAVEVLARWNAPHLGDVPPVKFISLAERLGFIANIDLQMLENALALRAKINCHGHPVLLSANLSPQTLRLGVGQKIQQMFLKYSIRAENVSIELTETSILALDDESRAELGYLRNAGSDICLDDFGTGYSSLAYLLHWPMQRIKIDMSFIAQIGKSNHAEMLIAGLLRFAEAMKFKVIAEGVETSYQAQWLIDHNCYLHQGYLYARPMSGLALETWLEDAKLRLQFARSDFNLTPKIDRYS